MIMFCGHCMDEPCTCFNTKTKTVAVIMHDGNEDETYELIFLTAIETAELAGKALRKAVSDYIASEQKKRNDYGFSFHWGDVIAEIPHEHFAAYGLHSVQDTLSVIVDFNEDLTENISD